MDPLEEPDNKGWLEDVKWSILSDFIGGLYKGLVSGVVSAKEVVDKLRRIV